MRLREIIAVPLGIMAFVVLWFVVAGLYCVRVVLDLIWPDKRGEK